MPQVAAIGSPQPWQRAEFRVTNVPADGSPFDPDVIRVDGVFRFPSGRMLIVPGFWYQAYQRALSAASESLSVSGAPEWRLRFTPPEPGVYSVSVTVLTNGQFCGTSPATTFSVSSNAPTRHSGYVRIASSGQYLETSVGQALRLLGENVCWPGSRGTYDYDTWFPAMQAASENYARLWMCPWAFGIEADVNSLTHYRLDRAWQLDYVLQLAEQRGIYVLLCLDYHGMFETQPDYWGGNNYWPLNPYNVTNGGPCVNQNAFFTNTAARSIYQKRLRYLLARYGYSQNLLAWEFFNEIDNVYAYLNPSDVAAWHAAMGAWLHTNDPYSHLVTTSLTGSSDRPEIWSLPQLDFAAYHSYGESGPASRLAQVSQSFLNRYGKPVMVGEFGTDWRGWNRSNDPYLRGLREGIWGGALGGSVGTAMSWYWENIQSENVYPLYSSLSSILSGTGWGRSTWTNITFRTSGAPPPNIGNVTPGAQPFDPFLVLSGVWGGRPSGILALANPAAADYAPSTLNSFVHGSAHSDLRVPFRLNAWLTNNARLVMHLNSVSGGAVMVVRSDGVELYRTNLPNLDGAWNVNNEYNIDIPVNLPAGKHAIDISNAGVDWFYLDWVRLENVLPAQYSPDWAPSPAVIGLSGRHESLIYVVAPGAAFPAGATNSAVPLQQGQSVLLTNWPGGTFYADWYDPVSASNAGRTVSVTTNKMLYLPLPDFREDLAGIVYPNPALRPVGGGPGSAVQFTLDSETDGVYEIQNSLDLSNWAPLLTVTNSDGFMLLSFPANQSRNFFRAKKAR